MLELSHPDGIAVRWHGRLCFVDIPQERAVILGHQGFLDYFTATFRGEDCVLDLEPNDGLPRS